MSDNKAVKVKAAPKIPTAKSASSHKAGGGDVKICEFSDAFSHRDRYIDSFASSRRESCGESRAQDSDCEERR